MNAPFNAAQIVQIQQALKYAHQTGQLEQVIAATPVAQLIVPDRSAQWLLADEHPYADLSRPMPQIPKSDSIALTLNDRVAAFPAGAANTEQIARMGFDTPSIGYVLCASVRKTDSSAFPVGYNPLDLFRIRFENTSNFRFQTQAAMGGSIVGTAQRPRYLSGPGWGFTTGTTLIIGVTPLIALLEIDVVVYTLDLTGPGNVA